MMNQEQRSYLQEARLWLRRELNTCITFWLENAWDKEMGGVLTCLDSQGQVYSSDKSVWMQGRCGWTFSRLCLQYGAQENWKAFAKSCLDFMEDHCINRDLGDRMYFQVTREGRPLRQRRYSFSEGFYAMANAEHYLLTGEAVYMQRARAAYDLILDLASGHMADPTGFGAKVDAHTRPLRGLAGPMIYLNLSQVLRRADPENAALYTERAADCVRQIFQYHRKKDQKWTLETVGLKGEFLSEVSMGRVLNPGHAIECAWFLMEEARYTKDAALAQEARSIFDDAISAGWDQEMGGLLYFIDCLGHPPEAYEHDMKLWWPHNEALIAALMAYQDCGEDQYFTWFQKTLDYCKQFFAEPEHGEWYGYLRRDGKPTLPAAKGSTFKGPFHLPRMLMMLDQMLGEILGEDKG